VRLPGTELSVSAAAKLSPSMGLCTKPFSTSGGSIPSRSYTVGTRSTACTYWWRTSFDGAILAGHDTINMSAVPPSSPAQRFQ